MERIPPEDERRATRSEGRSRVGQALSVLLSVLLLILILANNDSVEISLLVGTIKAPLWVILAVSALCGSIIGYFYGRRTRKRNRE
jgi:uncharacterized integral membrane protein